jgi:hypothetical protein
MRSEFFRFRPASRLTVTTLDPVRLPPELVTPRQTIGLTVTTLKGQAPKTAFRRVVHWLGSLLLSL